VGDKEIAGTELAGRHGRLALAQLSLSGRVHREALADTMWPDTVPRTWERTLSSVISRLRSTLVDRSGGTVTITYRDGFYALDPMQSVSTDVAIAEVAASTARAMAADCRWEEAARSAKSVVAALAEPFAPEIDAEWADDRRRSLAEASLEAMVIEATACCHLGQFDIAVRVAREAVRRDPLNEVPHRALIRALMASGDRSGALQAYEACRSLMLDEFDAEPSGETRALRLTIMAPEEEAPPTSTPAEAKVEVTFLLTDVEGSTRLWEQSPDAMAAVIERHDELIQEGIGRNHGRMVKARVTVTAPLAPSPSRWKRCGPR
jgi:DNA-binding SARP family transcriptional activator